MNGAGQNHPVATTGSRILYVSTQRVLTAHLQKYSHVLKKIRLTEKYGMITIAHRL